jgi:transposase-like protein
MVDGGQKYLTLYQQGMSFRAIERQTGVSHNIIINGVLIEKHSKDNIN